MLGDSDGVIESICTLEQLFQIYHDSVLVFYLYCWRAHPRRRILKQKLIFWTWFSLVEIVLSCLMGFYNWVRLWSLCELLEFWKGPLKFFEASLWIKFLLCGISHLLVNSCLRCVFVGANFRFSFLGLSSFMSLSILMGNALFRFLTYWKVYPFCRVFLVRDRMCVRISVQTGWIR